MLFFIYVAVVISLSRVETTIIESQDRTSMKVYFIDGEWFSPCRSCERKFVDTKVPFLYCKYTL